MSVLHLATVCSGILHLQSKLCSLFVSFSLPLFCWCYLLVHLNVLSFCSVSNDQMCIVWDLSTGKAVCKFPAQNAGPSLCVASGIEGSVFVGGSKLCEWESTSGSLLREYSGGHSDSVKSLAVGIQGTLISCSGDRFVCVWKKGLSHSF